MPTRIVTTLWLHSAVAGAVARAGLLAAASAGLDRKLLQASFIKDGMAGADRLTAGCQFVSQRRYVSGYSTQQLTEFAAAVTNDQQPLQGYPAQLQGRPIATLF